MMFPDRLLAEELPPHYPMLKELSDTHFPSAEKIVLVQDNLSTHTAPSLYAAFPAAEARRLAKRFEWHYTPKHGSWLDMAESELAVLTTQCLRRRIPNKQALQKEVGAWQDHRNNHHAKADWQFTTDDARVKLKRLYPNFEKLARLAQMLAGPCADGTFDRFEFAAFNGWARRDAIEDAQFDGAGRHRFDAARV